MQSFSISSISLRYPRKSSLTMWRTNKFRENQDSDQSISEEEELDSGLPEDCVSLGGLTEKKGRVQVLSRLEVLRDAHELDHGIEATILSQKRQAGICIQDAVEFPVFSNEGDSVRSPRARRASPCNSDDEIISDDEKVSVPSFRSKRKDEAYTQSAATRETESLVHLIDKAGTSSFNAVFLKANRSFKGGRGRVKSKYNSVAVNNKDETHLLSKDPSLYEDLEPIENRAVEHSMSELLELFQGEKVEHSEIDLVPAEVAVGHDQAKPSVAELLDCVLENNVMLGGNSITHSRPKGERAQLVVKRNICPLGDRNLDDDGFSEAFDSGPSSGDEDDHKNEKCTMPESKQKTMTDQFQEAFGISSVNDEGLLFPLRRQSGIGLFGKLQHVMQSEKERDIEFLRRLHSQASLTDGSYIDVRILSRCLEAKLTVCCCSFIRDDESSQCAHNSEMRKEMGRNSTIIFSARTCSDVELEAGKLIRIHPPWKEISARGGDEKIILSTYFSQILN